MAKEVKAQIDRINDHVIKQEEYIKRIKFILGLNKSTIGEDDTTATEKDLVQGKTAYSQGVLISGTVAPIQGQTITPSTVDQIIPSGIITKGDQIILGDINLKPENIAAGVTIFGITGTYTGGDSVGLVSGYVIQDTEPTDYNLMWVDSSSGYLLKVYDEETDSWIPVSAAYG